MKIKDILAAVPGANLKPGASGEDIASAERMLAVRFPAELRLLLSISDGFREPLGNTQFLYPVSSADGSSWSLVEGTLAVRKDWSQFETGIDLGQYVLFGSSGWGPYWYCQCVEPFNIFEHEAGWVSEVKHRSPGILELYRTQFEDLRKIASN